MARILALLAALLLASPAGAHALRVFATVEGATVSGYGFFVGGGRPRDAAWRAEMGGATLAEGRTDAEGRFRFAAPAEATADVVVTIDAGDGHGARATLPPERFGAVPSASPDAAPAAEPAAEPSAGPPAATAEMVEAAVARQVAPLLERIEAMDARMRITDVVSGACLILGIAGIALWARARRA